MGAELREILAEGDPFEIEILDDRGEWTHLVSYDDVVAHEFEEGVERSVGAVAAVAGVVRVVHEDREVLLVEAPGVAPAAITAALRAFWRDETERRPAWADRFDALTAELAPVLEEAGFRRRKARWNRDAGDGIVHVVELDHYDNGDGPHVVLELGVFEPVAAEQRSGWRRPAWVREHDCHLRIQSWTLAGGPAGTWRLDGGASEVVAFTRATALPFLDARGTLAGLVDADGREERRALRLHELDRAIVLAALGRRVEAQSAMDAAFVAYPRAFEHFRTVATRVGLEPPDERPPVPDERPPAAAGRTTWLGRWRRRRRT